MMSGAKRNEIRAVEHISIRDETSDITENTDIARLHERPDGKIYMEWYTDGKWISMDELEKE